MGKCSWSRNKTGKRNGKSKCHRIREAIHYEVCKWVTDLRMDKSKQHRSLNSFLSSQGHLQMLNPHVQPLNSKLETDRTIYRKIKTESKQTGKILLISSRLHKKGKWNWGEAKTKIKIKESWVRKARWINKEEAMKNSKSNNGKWKRNTPQLCLSI